MRAAGAFLGAGRMGPHERGFCQFLPTRRRMECSRPGHRDLSDLVKLKVQSEQGVSLEGRSRE